MPLTKSSAPAGVRMVACPGCGESTPFVPSNPWRPFCSERCKNGDLGAWSSESYRVAATAPEADDEVPEVPPAGQLPARH